MPSLYPNTPEFLYSYVMKVAASRDEEEYSLSMELAAQEIQFALVEKVGHLVTY